MSNEFNNLYEFEGFIFDSENRSLWFEKKLIPLPPKAIEVLFELLKADGNIVSKKDLLNTVWAETFVEEGVLTQSVYQLRQAFAAESSNQIFIENIARRGYRFAVPIKKTSETQKAEVFREQINELNYQTAPKIKSDDFTQEEIVSVKVFPFSNERNSDSIKEKTFYGAEKKSDFKKIIFAAIFFTVFGVLVLGIYFLIFKTKTDQITTAPIEQIKFVRLTDFGNVIFPTISPDGNLLAFVRHDEQEESVWIKQVETEGLIRILPPSKKGYGSLVFSPDGKFLYFRENADGSGIFQVSILGGTPKKIAENVWSDFDISPDGNQFAFVRRDAERNIFLIILSNLDGSGEKELTLRNFPKDYRGGLNWSPDGKKITVIGGFQRQIFPNLYLINAETGEETEMKIPRWRAITNTLWMPNGKNLIVSARDENESNSQIWIYNLENGEIRRLTNDLESYFWLSLTADGKKLIARQQKIDSHIWLLPDGDLKKAKQLTTGIRRFDGYGGLAWTADEKIIYTVRSGGATDIFSMNSDGGEQIQLTENAGRDNTSPVVSDDNRYIVFTSNRTGTQQIWRMDLNGQNQKQLTFAKEARDISHSPDISPDGSTVYFIRRDESGSSVWKISIEGGDATEITEQTKIPAEYFISVAPDGKRFAFRQAPEKIENQTEEPTIRIGISDFETGIKEKYFDLPMRRSLIAWSSDKTLDYFAGNFNSSSLMRLSIEDGKTEKLLDFPDRIQYFAWSKNGKNLAVSRGVQQGDAILITNLPE